MKKYFYLPIPLLVPFLALAQAGKSLPIPSSPSTPPPSKSTTISSGKDLLNAIDNLIDLLIPIAFSLALLFFFWGLAKFIFHAGDQKTVEEGKRRMLWGVIALFVIVSIWGIIQFIQAAFFTGPVPLQPFIP